MSGMTPNDGLDPELQEAVLAPQASVWPKVLLVVAFNAVIMALIGWASREGEYGFIPAVVVYGFLICCVELVVFFSLRAASGTRHWGHALLQGLALFVGLAVVVLGGLCFAGP